MAQQDFRTAIQERVQVDGDDANIAIGIRSGAIRIVQRSLHNRVEDAVGRRGDAFQSAIVASLRQHARQYVVGRDLFEPCQRPGRHEAHLHFSIWRHECDAGFVLLANPEVAPWIDRNPFGVEGVFVEGQEIQIEVVRNVRRRFARGQSRDVAAVRALEGLHVIDFRRAIGHEPHGEQMGTKAWYGEGLECVRGRIDVIRRRPAICDHVERIKLSRHRVDSRKSAEFDFVAVVRVGVERELR